MIEDLRIIREKHPVVHNITNYVAMNFTANALIAVGASPVMSFYPDEMEEIVSSSDSLVVNIGCLDGELLSAARIATSAADKQGKPWVLDPVGAGLSTARTANSLELAMDFHPSVIRGNASEILSLTGAGTGTRGVDSTVSSSSAVEAGKRIARMVHCVVSISGDKDYITDGEIVEEIVGGHPLAGKVTAMGCCASALIAAFLAVNHDSFAATSQASRLMKEVCGIAGKDSSGPGSFQIRFLDELSSFEQF